MTTRTKVALGAAALVAAGVAIYVVRRRKAPDGKVLLGELTTVNCQCFYAEYLENGEVRSTKRPRKACIDDGLDFQGCPEPTALDHVADFFFA